MPVATEQLAANLFVSRGCPCGWRSFDTWMSIATLRQILHQTACPASPERRKAV